MHGLDLDSLPPDLQQRMADVLDAYLARIEKGESGDQDSLADSQDVEQLLREYPDMAEPLRQHLDSLRMLIRATSPPKLQPAKPKQPEPAFGPGIAAHELGDFRLIRELGRGGMGVVYEAWQNSLGRRVAVKVLPFAAILEPKQIARFQHEAQAAAQLHHPNIVPVFAVGCERGVHYYSMQLVEGRSLEQAIRDLREREKLPEQNSPDTTAALLHPPSSNDAPPSLQAGISTRPNMAASPTLRSTDFCRHAAGLILQAAEALHYAHESGIVHRDIKPSNLMLEDRGKIWVTDFGLARMPTDMNLTVTGDILGTVRYMSPEQAAGRNHLVDHRTDIYSLGATLFELLTLRPLHEGTDRPTLLRNIESLENPSPRKFNKAIPRDLETILLKSIAKEREQRYASAQEFADDLRHFLAGRPTLARRPSLLDRATSWSMRHRRSVAMMGCGLLLALTGTAITALLLAQANQRTRDALGKSDHNYRQAREVVNRFLSQHAQRLADVPGSEPLQRELLEETLAYYQAFIQQAMHDSTLRSELADAYFHAGEAAEKLGDKKEALHSYTQAIGVLRHSPNERGKLANCLNNRGLLLWELGQANEAERSLQEAVEAYELCVIADPSQPRTRDRLATALANLGMILGQTGRELEARSFYNRALKTQEQLAAEHPTELQYRRGLAVTLNNLSHWQRTFDPSAAIDYCLRSLATQQAMLTQSPDDDTTKAELALTYNNLGALRSDRKQFADAEKAYREGVALQEQLARKRPGVVKYRRDAAITYNNLGHIATLQSRYAESLVEFREARRYLQQLAADYPQEITFRTVLAGVWNNEGLALEQLQQLSAASQALAEAIQLQRQVVAERPGLKSMAEALHQHYRHALRITSQLPEPQKFAGLLSSWTNDLKATHTSGQITLSAAQDLAGLANEHRSDEVEQAQLCDQSLQLLELSLKLGGIQRKELQNPMVFGILYEQPRYNALLTRLPD